ncbi:MAG: T9SS type A sorting domain-containing protein [Bacteroidales bacterium]|nr:T9SS type A sorting domain-containing protein [Bacteroidales bacterium]
MKSKILILLTCIISEILYSQALPVCIDGKFEDWAGAIMSYTDIHGDGSEIDFYEFTVSNDNDFLFIKLVIDHEIKFNTDNDIYLYIDTDNNSNTGYYVNDIGAELGWKFGGRYGYFNISNTPVYVYCSDIQLRSAPTVSNNIFEIAIGRNVLPDGTNPLFVGDTLKICFRDSSPNGDYMPNIGESFTYIFDNTYIPPPEPVLFEKTDALFIRLMTYNTLNSGLIDPARTAVFKRLIKAVSPDIITFNECWYTSFQEAKNFLDEILPLNNGSGWHAWKIDGSDITCTRYPVIDNWLILTDHRLAASLIDLPDEYENDILVINAHLRCCDEDEIRQIEADAFASFILDAKTPGGIIDLPEGTPFVLSGDLNLVGLSQQLKTLTTGEIINTISFGNGGPLDWDNTDLEDLNCRQSDKRMSYTWRSDNSDHSPGRLDFAIFSNSAMKVEKAYTIQTEVMPQERLALYGLQFNDTRTASDHFPMVTDFSLSLNSGFKENFTEILELEIFPNPATDNLQILFDLSENNYVCIKLIDISGKVLQKVIDKNLSEGKYFQKINIEDFDSGICFLVLETKSEIAVRKVIVLRR